MIEVSVEPSDVDTSDGDSMEQPQHILSEGNQQEKSMSTDVDTSDDDIKEHPELMIWQGNQREDITIDPSDPNDEEIMVLAHTLQLCGTGGTGGLDDLPRSQSPQDQGTEAESMCNTRPPLPRKYPQRSTDMSNPTDDRFPLVADNASQEPHSTQRWAKPGNRSNTIYCTNCQRPEVDKSAYFCKHCRAEFIVPTTATGRRREFRLRSRSEVARLRESNVHLESVDHHAAAEEARTSSSAMERWDAMANDPATWHDAL